LIGHQLVIAREHADGDGQIKTRPLLLDIRQREIDRGAAHGILNPELASAWRGLAIPSPPHLAARR